MDQTLFFVLVGVGALLWGGGNVLKSYYLRNRNAPEDVTVVATMLGASVFSFAAEFAWNGIPRVHSEFWFPFAITALLNVASENLNIRALKIEDASIVVPLASTMPAFLIVASWIILREFPTFWGRIGIVSIGFGAYVLRLKEDGVELPRWARIVIPAPFHRSVLLFFSPWIRLLASRGAQLALATAWIGAISVNFDKLATINSSPMVFTGGAFLVVGVMTFAWSLKGGSWAKHDKSLFKPLFFLGLLVGLYTTLMNAGYLYSIAPYVGSFKRTQIVWTVLLAWIFLKEKEVSLRIAGSIIIFLGAVLIAF